ncbi:MAG TPA: ATP-binding protein [Candidatus Obscuribacterales bacterium]
MDLQKKNDSYPDSSSSRNSKEKQISEEVINLPAEESQSADSYKRQLEAVCNNATVALFIMNDSQQCTYMNPAAEKLTGYTLAEVKGRILHDVVHHTRPDGSPFPLEECAIDRAFPANNQQQGEEVFVHKDGSFYSVAYTASPIREGADLVGTIIEVRDITKEKQIKKAREELDLAKTAFFSNVSHEFRTPLTLILGVIEEALADSEISEPDRQHWETVKRNSTRLLKLVNTLLDFSRIEAGRMQATYEPIDLAEYTRDLASLFQSAMNRAKLKFIVDIDPIREPVYVDPNMWEKIVLNLLSNALKFTFEGEIAISLKCRGSHVELGIRDTGIGIPQDELEQIFDRFHQVRGSRSRTHEGTGIGLALVKELIELHGGTIAVSSTVGAGTTFTISVPLGSAHLPSNRIHTHAPEVAPSRTAMAYVEDAMDWFAPATIDLTGVKTAVRNDSDRNEKQGRILIADDNADLRQYLVRILSDRWEVEAVADGLEAIEAIRNRLPDLVISDVMMPHLSGMELVERLRQEPQTRTLPIILLSARAGEEATAEGLAKGANDYLVKPFSARELIVRVAAQLEIARMRNEVTMEIETARASAEQMNNRLSELLAQQERYATQLGGLMRASLMINSTLSIDDILQVITEQARELIGAHQSVTSMTIDRNWKQAINSVSLSDKYAAWRDYQAPTDGSGIYALVCRDNRTMRMTQQELEAHQAWRGFGTEASNHPVMRGWLAAPLIGHKGQNLGLIQLSDKYYGEFTQEDEAILVQLAQMAAAAIQNAHMFQQVEQANHAKDEFLATVSHELRTPLNAILGWGRMLRTGRLNKDTFDRALETIERNAKAQAQLIEDLLDISRIISGKLRLDLRSVNLAGVIETAVDVVRPAADAKDIRLQVLLDPYTGPISGDPNRLQQVVWNLLSNAIKFTPKKGRVQIRLERVNSHIEIIVSDTGVGISPEVLPYIFERFRQADSSYTRQHGGLGLGLAIVRHLVELHGGSIDAYSDGEGQGATFTVKFPLLIIQNQERSQPEVVNRKHPLDEYEEVFECQPTLDGLNVLVVDDERDARELLIAVIGACGATVTAVASVSEALQALKHMQPDMLISDIEMPGEDGYSLMRKVRTLPEESGGKIPAIALTAHASTQDRLRSLKAGYQSHVAKPFEPTELIATIASLLGRSFDN